MTEIRTELSQDTINFLSLLLPPLLLLIGRAIVIRADRYLSPRRRRAMGWITEGYLAWKVFDGEYPQRK